MTYSKQTCLIKKRHMPASEKKKSVPTCLLHFIFTDCYLFYKINIADGLCVLILKQMLSIDQK